ncbi:MAG: hypothetical protein ACXITV_03960 [Luteibaculaceae bacterium]
MKNLPSLILALLIAQVIFAQTGPAGVGNASSNNIWLSADFGVFSDAAATTPAVNNSSVLRWNDRSGNGRNATVAAANAPTLRNSTSNNAPGIRFDGNQFIDTPAPGILENSGYTYLIAFRDTAVGTGGTNDGNGHFILDRPSATNSLVSLKQVATPNNYFYQKRNNSGGGLGGVRSSTLINSNFKIINMRRNYNVNYQLFYDNQLQGTLAETDGLKTPPPLRIGRHATTGNGGIRGFINELIVFNFPLNTAQTIILNNYLAAKYGAPLLANDVYTMDNPANGNFDFEVAGIGRVDATNLHTDAQGSGLVRINSASNLDDGEFLLWGHDNGSLENKNTSDVDGALIESRLGRVWRVSEVGDVGTVTLSFDVSGFTPLVGSDLRLLIDRDGDGFADNDITPITGTFVGGVVTFAGVNLENGDRFTLGSINVNQTPLPVELLFLKGTMLDKQKGTAEVFWKTASEINNDFFEVQTSLEGEFFTTAQVVPGNGTVSSPNEYRVTLAHIFQDTYVRLVQVDFDGTTAIYGPILISNAKDNAVSGSFKVIENPVNNGILRLLIQQPQPLERFQITDLSGRIVQTELIQSERSNSESVIEIKLSNQLKGNQYYVISRITQLVKPSGLRFLVQ